MSLYRERLKCLTPSLEKVYFEYNRREFVHPDPLEFLYYYEDVKDREIIGFIASSLAYGRVAQILKSVKKAIEPLGKYPSLSLPSMSDALIEASCRGFKHRFTNEKELSGLFRGLREIINTYGSVEKGLKENIKLNSDLLGGLNGLISEIDSYGYTSRSSLLVSPKGKSACKRLFLYLKWMVRQDEVDPGGWNCVTPEELIMPVDTHIFNISHKLGITERKNADLRTAIEITRAFAEISPRDPLKYDFALTRFGIRSDMTVADLVEKCQIPGLSGVSEHLFQSNK